MENKITPDHLRRMGVVYIRQSSAIQLTHNLESQRRQYGLADHAKTLGFMNVKVVDEDLGRSGSGLVERPGFQRVVAMVCAGHVGAILCIEASRLVACNIDIATNQPEFSGAHRSSSTLLVSDAC